MNQTDTIIQTPTTAPFTTQSSQQVNNKPAPDEIWYMTDDGEPYNMIGLYNYLKSTSGFTISNNIISNDLSEDSSYYILKFENDISKIGLLGTTEYNLLYPLFWGSSCELIKTTGIITNDIISVTLPENIGYKECYKLDSCCDYQKFLDKGGFETYQWLMSIKPPRTAQFCTRTASFTLPVAITNEIENIGTYSLLAKEYDEQKNYSSGAYMPDEVGTAVLYNGRSCFLKLGEDGFEYDPTYEEILWGNLMPGTYQDPDGYQEKSDADKEWVDGIEIYKQQHNIIETDVSATGVTSSKLPDLRDTKTFVDENSNVLPGSLNKDQNGVYVTPNTNEVLDIIYHEGNLANIKMLSIQYNSRGTVGLYSADYISEIVFYKKKNDDTEVLHTNNLHDLDFVDYYPLNVPFSQQERLQDGVFCDVTYWTNILFQKADYGQYIGQYRMVYPNEPAYYNAVGSELYYTETLLLTMVNNHPYWLNGSTSIPISYYQIEALAMDNEEEQSALATYYLKYKKYSKVNDYNGEIYSPVYFDENYIGISQPESISKSIYIDRGVNSAMQARLRLGDASCLNDLLQLGNGYFNILKNN